MTVDRAVLYPAQMPRCSCLAFHRMPLSNERSRSSTQRTGRAETVAVGQTFGIEFVSVVRKVHVPDHELAYLFGVFVDSLVPPLVRGEFSSGDAILVNHPAGLTGPSKGGSEIIRCSSREPANHRPDEWGWAPLVVESSSPMKHLWHWCMKVACGR